MGWASLGFVDNVKTLASTLIRDGQVWGEDQGWQIQSRLLLSKWQTQLIDLRYGLRIFLNTIRAVGPLQVAQEGTGVAIESWSLGG